MYAIETVGVTVVNPTVVGVTNKGRKSINYDEKLIKQSLYLLINCEFGSMCIALNFYKICLLCKQPSS